MGVGCHGVGCDGVSDVGACPSFAHGAKPVISCELHVLHESAGLAKRCWTYRSA
jgi:hypothetical protein